MNHRHEESIEPQQLRNVPAEVIQEVRARLLWLANSYTKFGTTDQRRIARGLVEAIKRREAQP